jgi:hypothetical protein
MTNIIYFPGFDFESNKCDVIYHHGKRFRNFEALVKALSSHDFARMDAWLDRRVAWGIYHGYGRKEAHRKDAG